MVSTYPAVKAASIRLPFLFMLSAFFITAAKSFSIHLQSRLGMPNMLFVAPVCAKHASTISLQLPRSGFQYFSTKAVAKSSCIQAYRRTKSFSSLPDILASTFSILSYSELEVIRIIKQTKVYILRNEININVTFFFLFLSNPNNIYIDMQTQKFALALSNFLQFLT